MITDHIHGGRLDMFVTAWKIRLLSTPFCARGSSSALKVLLNRHVVERWGIILRADIPDAVPRRVLSRDTYSTGPTAGA